LTVAPPPSFFRSSPVRQRRDDKARAVAQVLVAVRDRRLAGDGQWGVVEWVGFIQVLFWGVALALVVWRCKSGMWADCRAGTLVIRTDVKCRMICSTDRAQPSAAAPYVAITMSAR
jgi:hypothetical protein